MNDSIHTPLKPTVHTAGDSMPSQETRTHHPLIYVWVICIIIITMISGYLTYKNFALQKNIRTPSSFIECTNMPDSIIRESFPPVCVTKDGLTFTQPLTQEEQQNLLPSENTDPQ